MTTRTTDSTRLVIVGGGLAAARAIEAIRDGGHKGPVVLVGEESSLPYERPPLSKEVLAGSDEMDSAVTHDEEWYRERDVDLRLGVRATGLDTSSHTVTLSEGGEISWDRLLLATGSSVRRLDVPGADLAGVCYLRSRDDSAALRERLRSAGPVVIVGAGWIGLEVAAAARGYGCDVTVVEPQDSPLQGVVGPEIGRYFVDLHTSHGVEFRLGEGVQEILGDGEVSGVATKSGEQLPAKTVVVGIGITPNVGLAEEAGLEVDNGILCDRSLLTSVADIWAAGDVANWFNPTLQHRLRVDHWASADEGGAAAGRSMLGEDVSYDVVPYFFSDQYDTGLEYAGHVPRGTSTELVLRGDPAGNAFMAFWLADGQLLAGLQVNMWDTIEDVKTLIRSHAVVDAGRLADPDRPLLDTTAP